MSVLFEHIRPAANLIFLNGVKEISPLKRSPQRRTGHFESGLHCGRETRFCNRSINFLMTAIEYI